MKTTTLRTLFATAALGLLASFAYAGPGPQYWQTMHTDAQFKALKSGDKVAYVCNQCQTVSEIAISSPAHAMELCKEGATVTCPSCKMKSKVMMKNMGSDMPMHTGVTYVNDKGEECAFIAKVGDKP